MADPAASALAAVGEVLALADGTREERTIWTLFHQGLIRPIGRSADGQLVWDLTEEGRRRG